MYMYLSQLELINKCNQNLAAPTVNIPMARRFKVMLINKGQFPQISLNAAVKAFKFNNI